MLQSCVHVNVLLGPYHDDERHWPLLQRVKEDAGRKSAPSVQGAFCDNVRLTHHCLRRREVTHRKSQHLQIEQNFDPCKRSFGFVG